MIVLSTFVISCKGAAVNIRAQTLIIAMSSDVITMDPSAENDSYSANAMMQMYEGLLAFTPNNEVISALTEKYDISTDGMEYTFYLKKGIKFHNGEELKADDVVFSYLRAFTSPAAAHIFSDIDHDSLRALDDYTVTFRMKVPYAGILTALCHPSAYIVNKKTVEAAGNQYAENPIGTGPYKFVSHTKSDKIKFERYEYYQGKKPYYKYLEFRIIPDPTNRIIELESGRADIVYDISSNDLDRFTENNEIKLMRCFDYLTQFMGMNCSKPPLDDIRVRQAIACAIDTDQIVKTVWKDLGRTATCPYSPTIRYSIANKLKPIPRDVEKAKKLLKEAGYENGFKIRLSTNDRKERIDMAIIMKEQFKDVGIDLSIEIFEWPKYIEMLEKGEHQLFEISWFSDTPDPDMFVHPCFHSISRGVGGNYFFLNDPELDELITKGRYVLDGSERANIYKQIQERIMYLTPAVFQYNGEQAAGIRGNITGLHLSPLGHHFLGNIRPVDSN